ncbi:MAG TPA: universal stress protein [Holophagaceae bacterium]|nr:universal stress protein [Holophagaceae bacterium]
MAASAIRKVLVGLDFSEPSRLALEAGADWAARLGVPLEVIHVLPEPPMVGSAEYPLPVPDPAWRKDMEGWAGAKLADAAKDHPGAVTRVLWGQAGDVLIEATSPDTLLVLARRGQSALARFFFGSTASRVAAHAEGPVLLVGSGHPV